MKSLKKTGILLMILILVASAAFTGCEKKETAEEQGNNLPQDTAVSYVDQDGQTVTLEKPAEKVVTCFYGQSYAMIALGLTDRLVAMEMKASARPIYALAAPELLELPNVGSQKAFDVEAAISHEPDLVLLPKKLKDTATSLTTVGIPVALCYPESQELLEEQLTMIATLCGVPEAAEKLLSYYHDEFAAVEKKVSGLKEENKPVVYMGAVSSYLSTAPKDMYQATLIEKAGGVNAANEIEGDYWTEVSYEQILTMNPDIIVLPCEAVYTAEDILKDPQLSQVKAVQNGAMYAMPSAFEAWDSPVPSGVLGTDWLLAKLHPELYNMEEMRTAAKTFYETFYGFTPDITEIQ